MEIIPDLFGTNIMLRTITARAVYVHSGISNGKLLQVAEKTVNKYSLCGAGYNFCDKTNGSRETSRFFIRTGLSS